MGLCLPFSETDPETYSIVGASLDNSSSRTDAMHPMPQANAMNLKSHKSVLLGTSALVCLALVAPVMAADVQKLSIFFIKMIKKCCVKLVSYQYLKSKW